MTDQDRARVSAALANLNPVQRGFAWGILMERASQLGIQPHHVEFLYPIAGYLTTGCLVIIKVEPDRVLGLARLPEGPLIGEGPTTEKA